MGDAVVGGTGAAFFGFASAWTARAGALANYATMDSDWKHLKSAERQRHAQDVGHGLRLGAQVPRSPPLPSPPMISP